MLELKIPPPIVLGLSGAVMWCIADLGPSFELSQVPRWAFLLILSLLGGIVALLGVVEFKRVSTTVNPLAPQKTSSLVTSGIYHLTRNPMYLGMVFVLLGWAGFLDSLLSLFGVVMFVCYINRFQIGPEEQILRQKFGEQYVRYCAKVRRWF